MLFNYSRKDHDTRASKPADPDAAAICYDYQLKPNSHAADRQRYTSSTTGKCRWLTVQSTYPPQTPPTTGLHVNEVAVSGGARTAIKLAYWLSKHSPLSTHLFGWTWRWFWFILCLLWPFDNPEYTGMYHSYRGRFFGQLWAARSAQEYSARMATLQELPIPVPQANRGDVHDVTHARQLIIYNDGRWLACTDPGVLMQTNYMAVSYCQSDFLSPSNTATKTGACSVRQEVTELKRQLSNLVRSACLTQGFRAYWLDFECIGSPRGSGTEPCEDSEGQMKDEGGNTTEIDSENLLHRKKFKCNDDTEETENQRLAELATMNEDLYRIADVFRDAAETLILIRDRNLPLLPTTIDVPVIRTREERAVEGQDGWKSWGSRVWTFPEALLSRKLLYKFGSELIQPVSLRQIGNLAFSAHKEDMAIIEGYTRKDMPPTPQRYIMLKNAIWRRATGPPSSPESLQESDNAPVSTGAGSQFAAYTAEKVYALMGFFANRITPDPQEDAVNALVRLFMANDEHRLLERMVGMLPSRISDEACWYSDDDLFDSNLSDITPDVQVAGVSMSGALVLDGCRAAAIRWKDFPSVAFELKPTFRRRLCIFLPYFFWFWCCTAAISFLPDCITGSLLYFILSKFPFLPLDTRWRILFMGLMFVALLFAPKLLAYGSSGRVAFAEPWLIGVKGFMTADQVAEELYGCISSIPDAPTISYSTSGSTLAKPAKGGFRTGDPMQSELAASQTTNIYTLVDTLAGKIYYFTAARPPTVCLYVGREGGLGRYVLCSEMCTRNELHKETVLRMPFMNAHSMKFCDWLAVGGLDHFGDGKLERSV